MSQSGAYRVRERILAGPLTLLAGPKTPSVGPLTPRAGPQTFTAGPQTPTACPQTPTAGPKIPTAGLQTRLDGQLEAGSEGWLEEEEDGQPVGSDSRDRRTDGQTEFLYFTGLCPLSGPLPCYPLRLHDIKEAGQGYR